MKHPLPRLRTLVFVALGLFAAGLAPAATNFTWNGSGARLWSTTGNWLPTGTPGASDTASFFNAATAPNAATVNNTVAANTQIAALVYGQSNNFPHVTRINPGVTLTIASTNTGNVLFDGTAADNGSSYMSTNVIAGAGGTLLINAVNGNINVRQATATSGFSSHMAVLDLSGLDTLNATISRLLVAGDSASNPNNRLQGTLYLAKTNLIVAAWQGWTGTNLPAIGVSDGTGGNGGDVSFLYLGQTNALFADSMTVAGFLGGKGLGGLGNTTMSFNPAFTNNNPVAYLRGNSATRVGSLAIADNSSASAKSTASWGTIDFSGGTLDAMVDTIWVARSEVSAGGNGASSKGTLTFGAGTLDVNTMELGYQMGDSTVVYAATGTVNVNGPGSLSVNTSLRLAHQTYPPPSFGLTIPKGTLNVNGGSVLLRGGDILDGGGDSTVNVSSGLLDMQPPGRLAPGNIAAGTITVGGVGTAAITNAATITSANVTINPDGSIAGNTSISIGTNGMFTSPAFTLRGQFSGAGTVSGDFTQNAGAALNPGGSGLAGTLAFGGNLTLNGGNLFYDLSNDPLAGANDLITVTGNLNLVGTNTVYVNAISGALLNSTYPLITCGTLTGDATRFQVSGAAGQSRHTYSFATTANQVNLIVGGSDSASLLWTGDGSVNTWNVLGVSNWKNGAVASQFYNLDSVTFDDTGSAAPAVNVVGTIIPGAITVNNSVKDYTFSGSGSISGGAALSKLGTRTLTLAGTGTNNFTGPITISGGGLTIAGTGGASLPGSVTVGAGASLTVAGSGAVTLSGALNLNPGGTLTYNRSDSVACICALSGGGSFIQQGTGVLSLTADNSAFDGPIMVNAGTLKAGSATALGSINGGTSVASGATLDVNGFKLGAETVTVSGAGVGGNGAIINSGFTQPDALQNVTLAADATFGGTGNWGIRSEPTTSLNNTLSTGGIGRRLTKVGGNQVSLTSVNVDPALGSIDVQGGTLSLESLTTGLGNPASTLTIFTNATLQLLAFSQTLGDPSQFITLDKPIAMNDGSSILNAGGLNVIVSPITLVSGTNTISVTASNKFGTGSGAVSYPTSLTISNTISGTGSLNKSGGGTLCLAAANNFSGRTTVAGGTLALLGSGSITGTTNIALSKTTLDATGRIDGTLALGSGQTLTGNGTINGNLAANPGATVAPGTSKIGTLVVTNGTVQLAGTTAMKLDRANGTNDVLRTSGSITYGGMLTVTGLGGALVPGDTFKLFDAASYVPSSFATLNLPVGTTWDTSKLAVDGTIKVVSVSRPQVTGVTATSGSFRLTLSGPAGNSYSVWASTNAAATPVPSTWTPVATNGVFDAAGAASFTDTSATNYPNRFYLISVP